ncbi:zinc finger matrin-type protein 5 [Thrips palmi]|uniref:Zinc finger matrin-type protein 5 n=1 Tax=Thrips palmi TaxID=161013 RepID=A0A6P8Z282_THRPL|nr:zinc finger matrin-type protein 5 [Thrips palmi]
MGKIRYFCEYCDRSFLDDLAARKKHLTGTQHARMKKQYYLPYRSAKEIYEDEVGKEPCRKHLMQNMCPFEDSCKYSHYTPTDLERLRQHAQEDAKSIKSEAVNEALKNLPDTAKVNDWLSTWKTKQAAEALKPAKPAVQAVSKAWSTNVPPQLREWRDLPPSLQPWNSFNLQNIHVEDWG